MRPIGVLALFVSIFIHITPTGSAGLEPAHVVGSEASVWEEARRVERPEAGGLEAERNTWVRKERVFRRDVKQGRQEWDFEVSGDARPVMRRLSIENLGTEVESPFLLANNHDFRSVPELVASVTRAAKTDEEKALAIRELLIGEGFFFSHSVPETSDPICRLTSAGYGFCGVHGQIFDQLASAAGLRSRTCAHSFSYGHATNEVFYDHQWHFFDSNAETVIRRPDGVIPSYDDINKNPDLVPPGDAYGQTSFGIDGSRYARALYSAPTKCFERGASSETRYGTLDFPLRANESISWEWRDADFSKNRANNRPVFGTGKLDYRPPAATLSSSGTGLRHKRQWLEAGPKSESGRVVVPVTSPYPVTEIQLTGRVDGPANEVKVRVSKDKGGTWLPMEQRIVGDLSTWQYEVDRPEAWAFTLEREQHTESSRTIVAARFGYLLEIVIHKRGEGSPSLSNLRLTSTFRHYPPALPYLKPGNNKLVYVDRGARADRRLRVTMELEERYRSADLSTKSQDWGWHPPVRLSSAHGQVELPTLSEAPGGAIHLVYAVGPVGSRRIAYRRYQEGAWSSEELLTNGSQDANHPVVSEDGRGAVWVAYQTGGLWKGGDIYALSVKGKEISQPVRMNVDDPYHIAFFPSIATKNDRVAVSWEGGEPGVDLKNAWGTEVGWVRTFDGTSWGQPVLLKGAPFKNLGLPKVAYDRRGRLHLTATKGPRYYRPLSPDSDGKYQWLTSEWMYHSRGGALYADTQDNLWAVFDGQNSGTTNEIYCRMLPAASKATDITNWTDVLRVSEDDKRPSIYPSIVAETAGRVVVVWMDYRNRSAEVYAKVFTNGRWSPDLLISEGASEAARRSASALTPNQILWSSPQGRQSEYPHIARGANNVIWAIWQESDGGQRSHVVARRLTWKDSVSKTSP
jgi:hypothetical protein